jgi:cytochrome c oxidase assembly protein subunit 11
LFCQLTGYGGTTQRASSAPAQALEREITIRFDANVARDLPWRFEPAQLAVTLRVGEQGLAFYRAENLSTRRIVGSAAFNVTPAEAGAYFSKIECFCFTEQALAPGAAVELPVAFFVDPAIAQDRNLASVQTITLSYTFYAMPERSALQDRAGKTLN